MKLFLYDRKHDRINGQLDLGELSDKEKENIGKIIKFLEKKNVTDRYKSLVLANKYQVVFDDDFCEVGEIEFS